MKYERINEEECSAGINAQNIGEIVVLNSPRTLGTRRIPDIFRHLVKMMKFGSNNNSVYIRFP